MPGDLVLDALAALGRGEVWTFLSVLLLICAGLAGVALRRPADVAAFTDWLEAPTRLGLYGRIVGWALDTTDRSLTPPDAITTPDPAPERPWWWPSGWRLTPMAPDPEAARRAGAAAWSWPLFDLALRLAVVYPILLLFLGWVMTGEPGAIGSLVVLEREPQRWLRATALGAAAAALVFHRASLTRTHLTSALSGGGIGLTAIAGAFAVTIAVGLALTPFGAGAATFAIATAAVLAVPVAIIVNAGIAAAFALVFPLILLIGTVSLAAVVTVAVTVRRGRPAAAYASLGIGLLVALCGASAVVGTVAEQNPEGWKTSASLIVFLGLLPLANAGFDFASLGLTRCLLRLGHERPALALLCGIGDLLLALVLFTGLGLTCVAGIHLLNFVHLAAGGPAPLLDLQALFTDLRDAERVWSYWWLFAAFFSTLLPTLAHLAVACFSLVAWLPGRFRRGLLRHLPRVETHTLSLVAAWLGLSAVAALYLVAPLALLWLIALALPAAAVEAGSWYLWLFEEFARLLGAAVDSPPDLPEYVWT